VAEAGYPLQFVGMEPNQSNCEAKNPLNQKEHVVEKNEKKEGC